MNDSLGYVQRAALVLVAMVLWSLDLPARAEDASDFVLREQLGNTWSNECVSFPLNANQLQAVGNGKALVDREGRQTAYQIELSDVTTRRICFQVDLAPYQSLGYRFSDDKNKPQTDLVIKDAANVVRIENGHIGVEIRKRLQPGQGPLARIRLGSGIWTGGSTLEGGGAVKDYRADVVARGPVFTEVICRATFADGGTWMLRFRIERAEPVVIVNEQYDAPTGGVFRVVLGDKAFQPTHLMHRDSNESAPFVIGDPIADYLLEPWLLWRYPRRGNVIALYSPAPVDQTIQDTQPDMLVVGMLKPSLWVDPQWKGRAAQPEPRIQATVRDGLMTMDMPVKGGARIWLLGALNKADCAAVLAAKNLRIATPSQKLVIKHGDYPLNQVKDYILDWPGEENNHPCLFLRKQDLPALKARLNANPDEVKRWITGRPIDKYELESPIIEYIAGGDLQLGKRIADAGEKYLQFCVDWYLKQNERQTPGTAPEDQSMIIMTVNLLDSVLSSDAITPEARKRILAKLAFLGYVVNSQDYWSPERGYTRFANMTSMVALYRAALGCLLSAHPQGKAWAEQGLRQLYSQLGAWSDEDGGCLEAPHYAMVSIDHMLAGFTMAANAGYGDYLFDPRMRKTIEWFAAISTPRDSRIGGFRHQPPIGHTYHGEPTGIYGLMAALWKDRDPEFAQRMQWMYEQNGSFSGLGVGWNFPSMAGYRFLITHSVVTAKPADYGSTWFRKTGVVLRNTMQSDRETYLHMIAGSNHDHYDMDSGSIILYGKGRVLADDWGYIGYQPSSWHSMLTSTAASGESLMQIEVFSPSASLDYVSGRKGAWQRQIAFVKDADPLGPNFFVLRDTHAADTPAAWRLWLTANVVKVNGQGATVSGAEDVDLDIFMYEPGNLHLTTDGPATLTVNGWRKGWGEVDNTQAALVASLPGRASIIALLYPRLKTEAPPKVTWSVDGAVVQVESATGVDTVFLAPFLAPDPTTAQSSTTEYAGLGGGIVFRGTAGAVQVRGKSICMSLGSAGSIRVGDKELTADAAATRTEKR